MRRKLQTVTDDAAFFRPRLIPGGAPAVAIQAGIYHIMVQRLSIFLCTLLTNCIVTAQLHTLVNIDQLSKQFSESVPSPVDSSFHAGPLNFANFFAGYGLIL